MSPILVTGGFGFIGSAVVRRLLATTDAVVVNLDACTYAASPAALGARLRDPRHVHVRADVGDAGAVATVLREWRPGAVMHLAAETHVDRSIDGPGAFVRTNVLGTAVLLEAVRGYWAGLGAAARGAFRFHHVSTDEVFGSLAPGEAACGVDRRYDPRSPYAASKAAADHLVRAWAHTYGLPAFVTNTTNNYGPWQYPEKLIPLVAIAALEGRELPVYGDGGQIRDWLHVEDHAAGLVAALERGQAGETYLLGGRAEWSNLAVVRAICLALDRLRPDPGGAHARLIRHVVDRPGHDRRYALDPGAAEAALGWRATRGFAAGLDETLGWYLANRGWWEAIRARGYGGERLGTVERVA